MWKEHEDSFNTRTKISEKITTTVSNTKQNTQVDTFLVK